MTSQIAVQSNIWDNNSILKQKRSNLNKQSYMPFLFKSKRQFPNLNHQAPPVGSYQVPSLFDKLSSSQILNQPEILKQQFTKKNQMSIFKSSQQRFSHHKNNVPGPASYNYQANQSQKRLFKALNPKVQISKRKQKFQLIKRAPSCPAIPDSKVRYGYLKDQKGNYKLIQKSQTQVKKQKQKLKQYCTTLVNQNKYSRLIRSKQQQDLSKSKIIKNQQKIISNLQKYVNKRSNSQNQINIKQSNIKKLVKPKIKLSHDINYTKFSNQHLGPGCYNVQLNTLKKQSKKENYQFFNSSEIRFTPLNKQNHNPFQQIFKEKKNIRIKPNFQGKIYKKSFPTSLDPTCFQKTQIPGPGSYQPEIQPVKKSHGKVIFGYQSRFKQNTSNIQQNQVQQQQVQANSNMKWGNLRKQKIRSPHKQFVPVKSQQIYGIMNQEPQISSIQKIKKIKNKQDKNKQSAVFMNRSERFNICNKTYYKGESQLTIKQSSSKLWETKGSFISKLPKKYNQMKQNTPGPGTYSKDGVIKKSFNIKNN